MGMPGYYPGPPAMPNFPPPLPAGWSEHNAPDGVTKYYYNSNTKESTYTRPSFAPLPQTAGGPSEVKEKKKKKEKPKQKVEVPGTTWTRVTTSEGNVFYFEKESKRSEWTVPEEIKDAVAAMDQVERDEKERAEREKKEQEEKERIERIKERERIRLQIEEEREKKRKIREENGEDAEEDRESKVPKKDYEPENEEDSEAWSKAVAAEFAELDAATKAKEEENKAEAEREEQEAAKKVFSAPGKVNVTVAEGRALFKASHITPTLADNAGPIDRKRHFTLRTMGPVSSSFHQRPTIYPSRHDERPTRGLRGILP